VRACALPLAAAAPATTPRSPPPPPSRRLLELSGAKEPAALERLTKASGAPPSGLSGRKACVCTPLHARRRAGQPFVPRTHYPLPPPLYTRATQHARTHTRTLNTRTHTAHDTHQTRAHPCTPPQAVGAKPEAVSRDLMLYKGLLSKMAAAKVGALSCVRACACQRARVLASVCFVYACAWS
jgi:hypothetical protein